MGKSISKSEQLTDKKRTLILINIIITCFASSMMSTALTCALPQIISELNISASTGQWLSSGYSLCMGIIIPITAFLITRFPTKKLYLSALGTFIIGLALSIFSNSFEILMISRILQACGNGILSSMAQVVLLSIYPPQKRGSVLGWYGLSLTAAPVISPTISGVLIDVFNWKSVFVLPLIIVCISYVSAVFSFDDVLETSKKKFDVYSFILSIFAFGGVSLGIGNITTYGFMNTFVLVPLVLSLVTSILFINRQLNSEQPFLELRTFQNKSFTISVIGSMLLFFIVMGASALLPLYVQSVLGYSATVSGLVTLPGSLVLAIMSPVSGNLYDKFGMKKLFIVGSILLMISSFGMYFITIETPIVVSALLNIVRQFATGCLFMPFVTYGSSNMKKEYTAHATALLTSLRTIAGAIGMSVFIGIMSSYNSTTLSAVESSMKGVNLAFLFMGIGSIVLLCIALFGFKKDTCEEYYETSENAI